MDDMALLRDYAANNSETAFEELVLRRIGFVYSAALRQVRDLYRGPSFLGLFESLSFFLTVS